MRALARIRSFVLLLLADYLTKDGGREEEAARDWREFLHFPIALHPVLQDDSGQVFSRPPNRPEEGLGDDFGGQLPLSHEPPELPGIAGSATYGLRASIRTVSK